jgi:hypothetical protein
MPHSSQAAPAQVAAVLGKSRKKITEEGSKQLLLTLVDEMK